MSEVRATAAGVDRILAARGDSTFYGISVQGHCMGIVARTWRLPSQSAGYAYATDGADAVIKAGKMRRDSDPPTGAIAWWAHRTADRRPGHVATVTRSRTVTGNVGATIQDAALSRFGNLEWLGWCWPYDVPGWATQGPPTDPGDDEMPITDDDAKKIARAVWAHDVDPGPSSYSAGGALWTALGRTGLIVSATAIADAVWTRAVRTITGGGASSGGATAEQIATATADELAARLED
jgi:hypothetical protein